MSAPTPTPASAIDHDNPWIGLDSYTESSRGFFFGREAETDELSRLVRRQTLTVLFGQSGLGKSSLLQAGLFPLLRETDHLPLYLRLDHSAGIADQVKASLTAAFAAAKADAPAFRADETLWEYFHRKDVDIWSVKNRLLTPVLAFDQFEEIFTLGRADEACSARSRTFLAELACLVENRLPAAVQARLDSGELDPARFNFTKPSCAVILSLREDFLPDLEGLKREMPALVHNRLRLKKLSGTQALEIVTRPAPHLLAPGVAEKIVEFVAGARGGSAERLAELDVEPPLLSVICRELNDRRRALGQAQITADLVSGNRREILTDFYGRSVADLPEAMRAFVEDHLLTKSGFRDNLALETALEFPGVTRPLLDTLVARRLVRIEDRLGVQRVELTHDVLAEVIRASRDARQQHAALAVSLRRTRRQRWVIAGLATAVVGLLIGAFFGIRAQRRAEQAARDEAGRSSRTDLIFGSQLLDQGKVPEGIAFLVRAARTDPTNSTVAPRLMTALAYRAFALPIGGALPHPAAARVIGFVDAGRRVVTADDEDTVRIWDAATGQVVAGPMKHEATISATAVSPDGTRIAITCTDGNIRLWDAATGQPAAAPLRHESASFGLTFSPDSQWLASCGTDGTVRLWDARAGGLKATFEHGAGSWASSANFSADSTKLVTTAFINRRWRVWSVPSGEPLMPAFSTEAQRQANFGRFSPDGQRVVISDMSGSQLWDWTAGKKVGERMVHTVRSDYTEFSTDGSVLAIAASDGKIWLFDVPSGKERRHIELPAAQAILSPITLTRNGSRLMVACTDGAVRVYDTATGRLAMEPLRVGERTTAIFAPDQREIWTGNGAGQVRRWRADGTAAAPLVLGGARDPRNFRLSGDKSRILLYRNDRIETLDPAGGQAVAPTVHFPERVSTIYGGGREIPADLPLYVVRTLKNDLELWDLRDPAAVVRRPLGLNDSGPVVVFSPDRRRVAVRFEDRQKLRVFDTATGRPLEHNFVSENRGMNFIQFNDDGQLLAIANTDGNVRLWNLDTGGAVGQSIRHRVLAATIAFAPDGKRLATTDLTGGVRLWDIATGRLLLPPLLARDAVFQISFNRDGSLLLLGGSADSAAYLWDTTTGVLRTEPLRGVKPVAGAAFNHEESRVAVTADDGSLRIWGARSGQLLIEPLRRESTRGSPWFTRDGRFVLTYRSSGGADGGPVVWALPPTTTVAGVPDWMLRLATAVVGGEINAAGAFKEVVSDAQVFERLRAELTALPADAPFATWGRWFLADATTRTISPEHTVSATQAAILSGELLASLVARSNTLRDASRTVEAEPVDRQIIAVMRADPEASPNTLASHLMRLSGTLTLQGKFAEAEPLAREALALREATDTAESFAVVSARGQLGATLAGQQRYAEAEPLLVPSIAAILKIRESRSLNPVEERSLGIYRDALIRLYEATGRPEKAAELKK